MLGLETTLSSLPGFEEELVLDEECQSEHQEALDGHSTQVLAHHGPAERILEAILSWSWTENELNVYSASNFW